MTKKDQQLVTDAVRLTCVFNEKNGLNMLCHTDTTPSNCGCSCSKVIDFWKMYNKLRTKEIEL